MALMQQSQRVAGLGTQTRLPLALSRRPVSRVVCQAVANETMKKQAAAAAVVASALTVGTLVAPEVAVAAARSGGRVSSSSFGARRAPVASRTSTAAS